MGMMTIDPCELRDESQNLGRGCDAVPNIRSLLQDVTQYLCDGICPTGQLEFAVAPCGTPPAGFNALFNTTCEVTNRLVIVDCEANPSNSSELWFSRDNGVNWTEFTFPSAVSNTNIIINSFAEFEFVTSRTFGTRRTIRSFNFPTVAGATYEVLVNWGYVIEQFAEATNPVDEVRFWITTDSQGQIQYPRNTGRSFRNGHNQTTHYAFVGTGAVENVLIEFAADGTFPVPLGLDWIFRGYSDELTVIEYV